MIPGMGKPKYRTGQGGWTPDKLEVGKQNVRRIVPPIKSCADTGEWSKYWSVHFGWAGVNPNDPAKPKQRPFRCLEIRDRRTKMTKRACPACELIKAKEAGLTALEASLVGASEAEIARKTEAERQWLKAHNIDRKHYMNVMLPNGDLKVLTIANRWYKTLKERITKLEREEGIDAIDAEQGVWLDFTRTGTMSETVISPEPVYETVAHEGKRLKALVPASLTLDECKKMVEECPDLNEITRELSLEQVLMLLDCSGDPEEVDRIFGMAPGAVQEPADAHEDPANDNAGEAPPLAASVSGVAHPVGRTSLSNEEWVKRFGVQTNK